jgi:transcription antitermination factor NusG
MNWYVLYTRPRCEKKLAEYCGIHRVPHYLPLRRETKIYQRRKVTVEKPLFPGYFFCGLDGEMRLGVLKTNNVLRILEPGSRRKLLHQLAQIRKALRVDPTLSAAAGIQVGRRVRIRGGPFLGIEGMVRVVKGAAKVVLNVEMIGRSLTVAVDRDFLEVVDE